MPHFKHIGLYVYQRDFLLGYSALPVGPLERGWRWWRRRRERLVGGGKVGEREAEGAVLPDQVPDVRVVWIGGQERRSKARILAALEALDRFKDRLPYDFKIKIDDGRAELAQIVSTL